MFRQLVTVGPNPGNLLNNINSLFTYHPLQISAIVETVWQNRYNAASSQTSSPFFPWSPKVAYPLLTDNFFSGYQWTGGTPVPIAPPANFVPPIQQPGIQNTWDGGSAIPTKRGEPAVLAQSGISHLWGRNALDGLDGDQPFAAR